MTWGPSPIPVADAAEIGARHGYDQVIVIARKVGFRGAEFVTAWGCDPTNSEAANKAADFLKFRVMGMRPQADPATCEHSFDIPYSLQTTAGGESGWQCSKCGATNMPAAKNV